MRTGWSPNIMQQTMIRAQTKLEFAWGSPAGCCECINGKQPAERADAGRDLDLRGVRPRVRSTRRRCRRASSATACGSRTAARCMRCAPPSLLVPAGERDHPPARLAQPVRRADGWRRSRDPDLRPLIDRYLRGAGDVSAEERVRVFRLAWDFVGSALASRDEQYERFYLASGARNRQMREMFATARSGRPAGRPVPDGCVEPPASTAASGGGRRWPRSRVTRRGRRGLHRPLHRRPSGRVEGAVPRPVAGRRLALADVSAGGAAEVDAAVDAARRAFPAWAALGPEGRLPILRASPRASGRAPASLPAVETIDNGSLLAGNAAPGRSARGAEHLRSSPTGADPARAHDRLARGGQPRPLRSGRRRGADHALERAADADHLEGRAGARRRQHGGREAAGMGAAHLLADGRHRRGGRRAGRCAERRAGHRRRRPVRRCVNHADVDRISFTGSTDTARLIGQAAARCITPAQRGARRQVAVHRLRRCRPGRRRADRRRPVRQRRPGLPRRHARSWSRRAIAGAVPGDRCARRSAT